MAIRETKIGIEWLKESGQVSVASCLLLLARVLQTRDQRLTCRHLQSRPTARIINALSRAMSIRSAKSASTKLQARQSRIWLFRLIPPASREQSQQAARYDLNLAIASTLDLASVLRTLLEEIAALFPSCGASVEWINRNTGALEPIAVRNLGHAGGSAAPMETGLPLVVLTHQAPLTITNTHINPRTGNPEFFLIHDFIYYLGLPMTAKGEPSEGFPSTSEMSAVSALRNWRFLQRS